VPQPTVLPTTAYRVPTADYHLPKESHSRSRCADLDPFGRENEKLAPIDSTLGSRLHLTPLTRHANLPLYVVAAIRHLGGRREPPLSLFQAGKPRFCKSTDCTKVDLRFLAEGPEVKCDLGRIPSRPRSVVSLIQLLCNVVACAFCQCHHLHVLFNLALQSSFRLHWMDDTTQSVYSSFHNTSVGEPILCYFRATLVIVKLLIKSSVRKITSIR
jgi:hypothetical protein